MSSLLFGEHRGYLADAHRVGAFRRAIERTVSPGTTVLDLGSGTGVLGLLACRAGAGHVYAVDGSAMLGVARAVLRANGLADRVTFLQAHSRAVELPERVDVVVADQLGAFGVEAGLFEAFADARRRHLVPGGTLLPAAVELLVAPVSWPERWAEVAFWDDGPDGIDLRPVGRLVRNTPSYGTAGAEDLLGPPATVARLDPGAEGVLPVRAEVRLIVERSGVLHGLAGWFAAELAPGITVTNSPLAPDRLRRSHVFLPFGDPLGVEPGAVVDARLVVGSSEGEHRWSVRVVDPAGTVMVESAHAAVEGMPLTKEALARTRPDHRPQLTAKGAARATVLSLCDGDRTVADLEAEVRRRHPELFADQAAAAAFVLATLDGTTT